MNKLDALIRRRAEERLRIARTRVASIVEAAKADGIDISVIGSLKKGGFRVHSDVDLLVHGETDPTRRATIERLVAGHFRDTDIPYDLIFASDISTERVRELLDDRV